MKDECNYCGSGRVVPVLDVRMEGQPHGGNPYRSRCLGCARWLPMASKSDFKNHLHPHVLTKESDPKGDSPTIPLEEWDYSARYEAVLERIESYADRDRPYSAAAATDGGEAREDVDDQADDVDATNVFECPNCSDQVTGYPDECPHCARGYTWLNQ